MTARPCTLGNLYIETFSGGRFYYENFTPDMVKIIDVAHALANSSRYAGHCRKFYSVAEHSVLVSKLCPPKFAMMCLLHDASEAYMPDLPTPLKVMFPQYKRMETEIQNMIYKKYAVDFTSTTANDVLQLCDSQALLLEAKDLVPSGGDDWGLEVTPPDTKECARCLPPKDAKALFMERFVELTDI